MTNTFFLFTDIIFPYNKFFILLCFLVGFIYAFLLYYKDNGFGKEASVKKNVLATFRFLTVSIICLLLLTPLLRSKSTQKENPVVVVAHDNSESALLGMNEQQKKQYKENFKNLIADLSLKYVVDTFSFGQSVRKGVNFSNTDKATDLSAFLNEMYDLYSNLNLGAVVWATDGIYNQGSNPLYLNNELNVPVMSIALGDTLQKKDLVLKKIYNNQIAYLGDKFSAQIDIAAINSINEKTQLTVFKDDKKVYSKIIDITSNDFFITQELILETEGVGVQKYVAKLSKIDGENTIENNAKSFYIDILDSRQKILIIAESPHPDIAALRRSVLSNKNYLVEIAYADDFNSKLEDYDLAIIHQLPSSRNSAKTIFDELTSKKVAQLHIVGTLTELSNYNQIQNIIEIEKKGNQTNESQAIINPAFNLFNINEDVKDLLPSLPPVFTPFADFNAKADAQVLLSQKISTVNTNYPLLVFGVDNGIKKAVITGEGIWKWRLVDYVQNLNHNNFDEIIGKTIQYLSNKEDKRKFKTFLSNTLYDENDEIVVDAELYNSNYELINSPEVSLILSNSKNDEFQFTFSKTDNAYKLNFGRLQEGNYTYEATTTYNNEVLKSGGSFTVKSIQLEVFESTANHKILHQISSRTGGRFYLPEDMNKIPEDISAEGLAKPILYETVKTRGLIHQKWIFALLMFLLGIEWFFRRFLGSY